MSNGPATRSAFSRAAFTRRATYSLAAAKFSSRSQRLRLAERRIWGMLLINLITKCTWIFVQLLVSFASSFWESVLSNEVSILSSPNASHWYSCIDTVAWGLYDEVHRHSPSPWTGWYHWYRSSICVTWNPSLGYSPMDIFPHLTTCTSDGVSHMWDSLRLTLCELHIVDHKLVLSLVHELVQFAEVRNEYFE